MRVSKKQILLKLGQKLIDEIDDGVVIFQDKKKDDNYKELRKQNHVNVVELCDEIAKYK